MRAAISLSGSDMRRDGLHVVGREPVDDRAVALASREAQHAFAQRGDEDRRLLGDLDAEAEPAHAEGLVLLVDLLAGQRGAQEPDRVAHALIRLVELEPVPTFDDDVR